MLGFGFGFGFEFEDGVASTVDGFATTIGSSRWTDRGGLNQNSNPSVIGFASIGSSGPSLLGRCEVSGMRRQCVSPAGRTAHEGLEAGIIEFASCSVVLATLQVQVQG